MQASSASHLQFQHSFASLRLHTCRFCLSVPLPVPVPPSPLIVTPPAGPQNPWSIHIDCAAWLELQLDFKLPRESKHNSLQIKKREESAKK